MGTSIRLLGVLPLLLALCACGSSSGTASSDPSSGGSTASNIDLTCDNAVYPSATWLQCEAENYAMVLQAPEEEVTDPPFLLRWTEQSTANTASFIARDTADPSWLLASSPPLSEFVDALADPADISGVIQNIAAQVQKDPKSAISISLNTPITPLCASWSLPCSGDPYGYPGIDPFYDTVGEVSPVVFYDSSCARLSGRVWRPQYLAPGATLPGVVIDNGSVEAPETLYWWAARLLVANGYEVLTFDPRGQGRSDMEAPDGEQGGNVNVSVFWTGLVDAIDFFRSTPNQPYPNNITCAGTYPTVVAPYNPYYASVDPARLGIAGHSAGAEGVSVVQGYGGPGAAAWPGKIDKNNPVKVAVAWDGKGFGGAGGTIPVTPGLGGNVPKYSIRVPAMDEDSEYGLDPIPYVKPPDPQGHKAAYAEWAAAGVPVYNFTVRGSTHYEWSLLPAFPATSWCPQLQDNECSGGWGNPMAQQYTLAWFDRWLKNPGETGYDTADERLLDDDGPNGRNKMSWHSYSARDYPARDGSQQHCENIRAGCS
jgi:hypothetical protein